VSAAVDHDAIRMLLGGYLLGGLDEHDVHTVDAHLRTCAECREELDHLGVVPGLLQRLPHSLRQAPMGEPPPVHLEKLLREVKAGRIARQRRARLQWLAAAAALLVLMAGGVTFYITRGSSSPAPAPTTTVQAAGTTVEFTSTVGCSGQAVLTGRQWGTSVAIRLKSLPPGGPYVLEVVDRSGHAEQAATWGQTSSAGANVTGASSIPLLTVGAVKVTDRTGKVIAEAAVA
jgi:predicted anti-sigma-YlaC factor YlaD